MKIRGNLSTDSIYIILSNIQTLLQKKHLESKRLVYTYLIFEEIMYIYRSAFGKNTEVIFESRNINGKLSLIFTVHGVELDPINNKEAEVYKELLKRAPDMPVWEYINGKNVVVMVLPLYNTMKKNLEFAWFYTRRKKKVFFLGIITQIAATVLNIAGSFFLATLIVDYTKDLLPQTIYTAIAIFILGLIEQAAKYIASRSYVKVSYSTLADIQNDLTKSVLDVRTNTMNSYGSGLFIRRMTDDTATFAAGLNTVMDLLIQIGSFVGTLVAILIVSPATFIFELVILVLLYIVQHHTAKKLIDSDRIARKATERYSGFITEIVRGFTDIRTLHCERSVQEELHKRVIDSNDKQYTLGVRRWGNRFLGSFISNSGTLIFMVFLAFFIHKNTIPIAMCVVLFNYHTRLGPNVIVTIDKFTEFYSNFRLSCERINDLIYGQEFPKENFGTIKKGAVEGDIEFRDVSFSYRRGQNKSAMKTKVLKGLSFKIKAKQTAAFVGPSGCGKSTIIRLLDKLYLPDSGKILLDRIDINELDKDTLRNSIAVINQDPYIFHATIRDNLRIVKPDMTDEQMINVCKAVCIHDDIMGMEKGYDTVLGEDGVDISGGQKQRLAIARGFLCDASVFVLDEATSALDNNTQSKVLDAIRNLGKEHTVLVIAHRLSTVVNADVIFYISDGHIIDSGSHEELLVRCDEYRELYHSEVSDA